MSDWIHVDDEPPVENVDCRVYFAESEQEPFYRYIDSEWHVQKDNGVWKKSHFSDLIMYYYRCPSPPEDM